MFKRGDIVICILSGDYGKPRPGVVVQSNLFNTTHASITICPITSHQVEAPLFRLSLEPSSQNGLKSISQIMVDKVSSLKKEKVQKKIGTLSKDQILILNNALKLWLEIQ